MKKIICTLLALLVVTAFTGCSHEHTAETIWSIGIDSHWHACKGCKEHLDAAEHSFDENGNCTVCTAGIYKTAYGLKEAKAFDDHGTLVLHITYDSEGNIQSDQRYIYEYYDDGNIQKKIQYTDRVLVSEDLYQYCEDSANGVTYRSDSTLYYSDVSTVKCEYSENGLLLKSTTYNADGEVYSVDRYEYEFDQDGNRTKLSIYTNDELKCVVDDVNHKVLDYDGYGGVKMERTYVYDENGNLVKDIVKVYDRLDLESYYTTDEDGTLYVFKTIYYDKDGEVKDEVYYDVNGNILK